MGCVYLIEKKKMDKEHVLLGSRRLGRGRGRNGSERADAAQREDQENQTNFKGRERKTRKLTQHEMMMIQRK